VKRRRPRSDAWWRRSRGSYCNIVSNNDECGRRSIAARVPTAAKGSGEHPRAKIWYASHRRNWLDTAVDLRSVLAAMSLILSGKRAVGAWRGVDRPLWTKIG
jgi:hypothetical protein